ncbi:phosphatase PAP2 family protein [uncultured Intestinimonas sp.]|uniref:phosphatase PAP2 family protein n=1 Tax=uncultured Intestinimonas sp. TaxID=1689265 RepID=UPI002618D77F|nr:phosphatase PAP2 family protein [uncultured Intestinimonas sp.]
MEALSQWEGGALLWIQEVLWGPVQDAFFSFYTQLGNGGILWIALCVVLLFFPRTRKAGFWALIAMLFGLVCTNVLLKHLVGRTRPWLVLEGLVPLVVEDDPNSFPSGHTCAAFACCVTWARCTGKRWLRCLCIAAALLMGFSRLYVGVHFPSDVLAGCAVGCLCAWLSWRAQRAVEARMGGGGR